MITTDLFINANVKQLRTGGNFRILLQFFSLHFGGVGILNSENFNSFFTIGFSFARFWGGLRNFGIGGLLNPPNPSAVRHWGSLFQLRSWSSSVNIVSRLNPERSGFRISIRVRLFHPLQNFQTLSVPNQPQIRRILGKFLWINAAGTWL